MSVAQRPDPASHYNRVTDAWQYLLGDDLHYGYFTDEATSLKEATEALTRLLAAKAKLRPGMRVLDAGCGTGNPALTLAREYDASVLGISTSEVGLERARTRTVNAQMERSVRFELRDATATSLDAESFDCVWVLESSHLMRRKDLLLREAFRVLRRGGRLALCDIVRLRPVLLPELLTIQKEVTVLDQVFGRAAMEQLSQYRSWAEEAGFRNIETIDISRETLPTFERWRSNLSAHSAIVKELFGEESLANFRRACDILAKFWLDWLGYGILVAERAL